MTSRRSSSNCGDLFYFGQQQRERLDGDVLGFGRRERGQRMTRRRKGSGIETSEGLIPGSLVTALEGGEQIAISPHAREMFTDGGRKASNNSGAGSASLFDAGPYRGFDDAAFFRVHSQPARNPVRGQRASAVPVAARIFSRS